MLTAFTSRIAAAVKAVFNKRTDVNAAMPKPERPRRETSVPWYVNVISSGNRPVFGPWTVPSGANAWISRQGTRHRLRALMFQSVSQQQPLWSRRSRRRWARAAAKLEYLRMMEDTTNMVPNEKELLSA